MIAGKGLDESRRLQFYSAVVSAIGSLNSRAYQVQIKNTVQAPECERSLMSAQRVGQGDAVMFLTDRRGALARAQSDWPPGPSLLSMSRS